MASKAGLTAKQEGFVLDVFKGEYLAQAYRNNYDTSNMTDKSVWELASREMAKVKVASRLAELQMESANKAFVTVQSITDELEDARAMAIKENQAAAMTGASMGKAKLHGLLPDKHEITGANGGPIETATTIDTSKLSTAAMKELIAARDES